MIDVARIRRATWEDFRDAMRIGRMYSVKIRENVSTEEELRKYGASWYLTADERAGFGVTLEREAVGLWSLSKGRGDLLVRAAIRHGAEWLTCFDGYLVTLYKNHGFTETGREKNWTDGKPDVVTMALPTELI